MVQMPQQHVGQGPCDHSGRWDAAQAWRDTSVTRTRLVCRRRQRVRPVL